MITGRLQPLREGDQLTQRPNAEPRAFLEAQSCCCLLGHPDRKLVGLALGGAQAIRRRRVPASLTNPQRLARQGVQRVTDDDASGTGILLWERTSLQHNASYYRGVDFVGKSRP
jgi:hypothetical protein